jgi:hypothetical protein
MKRKLTLQDVYDLLPARERRFLKRRVRDLGDLCQEALDDAEVARLRRRFAELRLKAHRAMCARAHQRKRCAGPRHDQDNEMLRLRDEERVGLKDLRERFGRRKSSSVAVSLWRARKRLKNA